LPARNSGLGYASVRSRWITFGSGATWRSEHGSQNVSTVGADLVAMALGNLVQDAVDAEDTEQIRDASASSALVLVSDGGVA
jgi:hypothetical protein